MSRSRRITALIIGVLIAPFITVVSAGTASAHGYVSNPPSRQAQCASGTVKNCGEIVWEPQSVEGPKGLKSCNGGDGRWAELNDDNFGWKVANVSSTTTFTWTIESISRHATKNWEYWIGGTRVANFEYGGKEPPVTLSQSVNLGSFKGKQKVLAIWNVYDTENAYYACVDVNIS
ncbi:chitin-binding protein [Pseudonocardiaceae bacterium YIM PH 21723]|nr:chitin-binding protein [Pseudonocardiaceae bacterium YIM PH 21723]